MSSKESSLLQRTYLQKSRLFLLPLTGLTKDKYFKSTNTYISSDDLVSDAYPYGISKYDEILIITYSKDYKVKDEQLYDKIRSKFKDISSDETLLTGWEKFETEVLLSNSNFLAFHEVEEEFVYTYDLSEWHTDWDYFIKGSYSKLSEKAKEKIMSFRWSSLNKVARDKLYCYLYPTEEKCMLAFAEELKIEIKDLLQVKELCDKPDFDLETFKCLIKENS